VFDDDDDDDIDDGSDGNTTTLLLLLLSSSLYYYYNVMYNVRQQTSLHILLVQYICEQHPLQQKSEVC
jgi:hypothetical protein